MPSRLHFQMRPTRTHSQSTVSHRSRQPLPIPHAWAAFIVTIFALIPITQAVLSGGSPKSGVSGSIITLSADPREKAMSSYD